MDGLGFIFNIHFRNVHELAAHLMKSLSLQRFGDYISPHASCMAESHIHLSTLDDIGHKEIFHIHMFFPPSTGVGNASS